MPEEQSQSELTQEVEALKEVAQDLAELLTNSVNMVDKYYEIFFDQTPHYVELEQYDKDGILRTTLVPNRAMDKTVALAGEEDPEGVVDAVMGALYVNTVTRQLFMKKTAEGNIGWSNITPQPIEMFKETFSVNSETYSVKLIHMAYSKDYIDIYVNGQHLEQADYDLGPDRQTIDFNTQFPDYSTMQVSYLTGLYGIKGDTALTFRVGTVQTVPFEQPARVENVGTDEDIILDFDIPQGENGDSGVWVGPEEPEGDQNVWIDTSAEGFADDELGVARIFDSGNNTNPIAYKKAYDIKHSSVDQSKFLTFGHVVIDDNGYMTVLEDNSGVKTPVRVKQMVNKNWSISGRDYFNSANPTHQYMFTIGEINGRGCTFYFRASDGAIQYIDRNESTNTVLFSDINLYQTYGAGWYNWKVEYKDGAYYFYISYGSNDLALQLRREFTNIDQPLEGCLYLSADNIYNHSVGKSDLKVYTVIIDGLVVWTPNYTGVQYIYNDHFDKVGNPTIIDTGILTNVMNGKHFIYGDLTADALIDNSWDIVCHFKHIGTSQVLWQFADPDNIESVSTEADEHAGDYKMLSATVDAEENKVIFYLTTGVAASHSEIHSWEFEITENNDYYCKVSHEKGPLYAFSVSEDPDFITGVRTITYNANTNNKDPYVSNVYPDFKICMGTNNTIESTEKIIYNDLNYFKVRIHNEFAYRPLLRVPCTFSKYGAIFVIPKYRNLIEDAYNTHGIGNIWILDEEHKAVTLPLVDIYSLIEKEYDSRPDYGKGLNFDERKNLVENLVEGLEIGDIGEAVSVNEALGTRRILNGQVINIGEKEQPFFEFVDGLRSKGLVVTEEEWQQEAGAEGDCNKFVISSSSSSVLNHYYAYIPDIFVIRTPVIVDGGDDNPIVLPTRYCTGCGAELTYDQVICHNCHTVNDIYYGNDNAHLEGDNVTDPQIIDSQSGADMSEPNSGSSGEGEGEGSGESQQQITYVTSISEELTEADIIYTTSQDPLAEGTLFRKVNGIIYPVTDVLLVDVLNTDYYYRYDTADFEQTVSTEAVNYIRIPRLTNPHTGYVYYIQIATGVKNDVNIENTYEVVSPYAYGMYQYSDVNINNAGWLESDGSWYNGDMYPTFYEWIKANAEGRNRAPFKQPIFTSNQYRAFGGAIYTVTASHEAQAGWRAFKKSLVANEGWWTAHGVTSVDNPCWLQFHSTVAIVPSKVTLMNENTSPENFQTGYLQVSNDGSTWKTIHEIQGINSAATGDGNPGGLVEVNVDWNNTIDTFTTNEINLGFNYIRFYFTASFSTSGISIQQVLIEGTQTYLDRFKKWNDPAYSITDYDFVIKESDRTFRLPLLANACDYSKMRFLVNKKEPAGADTYTWWNLYSDGYLEQGGRDTSGSGAAKLTTMPLPFKDTFYYLSIKLKNIQNDNTNITVRGDIASVQSFNTRGTYNNGSPTSQWFWWEAKGYTTPPAFDTYRHLLPRLYYYVGDTVQSRKEINMAELANEIAVLKQRIQALGG